MVGPNDRSGLSSWGGPPAARRRQEPSAPRVRSTLPLVEPVPLTARPDAFNDPAWLFEPKYDGYRGLLYVTRRGCSFRSKRDNVLERFQELCYSVREELPVKEAILDGEVVARTAKVGRTSRRC